MDNGSHHRSDKALQNLFKVTDFVVLWLLTLLHCPLMAGCSTVDHKPYNMSNKISLSMVSVIRSNFNHTDEGVHDGRKPLSCANMLYTTHPSPLSIFDTKAEQLSFSALHSKLQTSVVSCPNREVTDKLCLNRRL